MRHGNKVNHLGKKTGHRKAMLSNMACSLIEHKRITTTLAKAKTLRVFVEPILTKSKTDSTHSRRVVFSYLQNKDIVSELFRDIAPKIAERNGGYTRIIRTGHRLGDNAEMCLIELVDFNELYSHDESKKTTRRSRRGGSKKTDVVQNSEVSTEETTTEEVVQDAVEETTAEEVVQDAVIVEETDTVNEVTEVEVSPETEITTSDSTESSEASEESSEEEKKEE
ncbi:MAG: 50S ribosomal protein L17 [Bacteroidetes bacterium]|nr:50S ribosomal protein L17 [Bacteroidota bacterium]